MFSLKCHIVMLVLQARLDLSHCYAASKLRAL